MFIVIGFVLVSGVSALSVFYRLLVELCGKRLLIKRWGTSDFLELFLSTIMVTIPLLGTAFALEMQEYQQYIESRDAFYSFVKEFVKTNKVFHMSVVCLIALSAFNLIWFL